MDPRWDGDTRLGAGPTRSPGGTRRPDGGDDDGDGSDDEGAAQGARLLVFSAAALSLEVEVLADRIVGQIVPPGSGSIFVETTDGSTIGVQADELGFFVLPILPTGPVRLRCDTASSRLVTDWLRLIH